MLAHRLRLLLLCERLIALGMGSLDLLSALLLFSLKLGNWLVDQLAHVFLPLRILADPSMLL